MMMGWAAAWLVKAWLVNAAAAQDVAHCIVGGFRTLGEPEVHIRMRENFIDGVGGTNVCLLYTSPSPRDPKTSRMPSSA